MSTWLRCLPALWPNDKAFCFLTLMMISIRLDDLSFYQMNTFKVAYRKSFTILIQWPYFFDLANKNCKNQVCNILTSLFKGPLFDCFFFFLLKRRRRRMRNHLTFIIFIKRIKEYRITLRHVKKKHGYSNVLLYLNHSKHLLNKFML
jgi:hypothetical protein